MARARVVVIAAIGEVEFGRLCALGADLRDADIAGLAFGKGEPTI